MDRSATRLFLQAKKTVEDSLGKFKQHLSSQMSAHLVRGECLVLINMQDEAISGERLKLLVGDISSLCDELESGAEC